MESEKLRERNRLANVYRRECQGQIGSPFRQKLYIDARLAGKSPEQALAIARVKPKGN